MQVISGSHSISASLFADDVENSNIIWSNLVGGEEVVDSEDLSGDATLGVYGSSAENCAVFAVLGVFVWEEWWDLSPDQNDFAV